MKQIVVNPTFDGTEIKRADNCIQAMHETSKSVQENVLIVGEEGDGTNPELIAARYFDRRMWTDIVCLHSTLKKDRIVECE